MPKHRHPAFLHSNHLCRRISKRKNPIYRNFANCPSTARPDKQNRFFGLKRKKSYPIPFSRGANLKKKRSRVLRTQLEITACFSRFSSQKQKKNQPGAFRFVTSSSRASAGGGRPNSRDFAKCPSSSEKTSFMTGSSLSLPLSKMSSART